MKLTICSILFALAAAAAANPIADAIADVEARQDAPGCETYSGWPWPEYTGPCEATSASCLNYCSQNLILNVGS
jgi:hypothetical protein